MANVRFPTIFPSALIEKKFIDFDDRIVPFTDVIIGKDKISLNDIGYNFFLKNIYVEQNIDMIDIIELEFLNINKTNDIIFSENQPISFFLGFQETKDTLMLFNNFTITQIEHKFISGLSFIKLICLADTFKLAKDEQRRKWIKKSHSSIAHEIADIYGLENITTIDNTTTQYNEISQFNISDYLFLKQLAKINGFVFYIENNKLHFHIIKAGNKQDENNNLIIPFNQNVNNTIFSVEISIETYGKNINPQRKIVDRLTGKINSVDVENNKFTDEILTQETNSDNINISDVSQTRTIYSNQFTISESLEEAKLFLSSQKHFSDFAIKMRIEMPGHEQIQARRLIEIQGLDRFDGVYFVTKVIHSLENNFENDQDITFTTTIECYKKFIGLTNNFTPENSELMDFLLLHPKSSDVIKNSPQNGIVEKVL